MKKIIYFTVGVLILFGGYLIVRQNSGGGGEVILTSEEVAKITLDKEQEMGVDSSPVAKRYQNAQYGFSFEKPVGYTVGVVSEGEGDVILVQAADKDSKQGFQIFVNSLEQPIELTPQLIQRELPGTEVRDPLVVELDGSKGIIFNSNNSAFDGGSFEIWFTNNGYVYQITSYAEFSSQLQDIIGTWKFN